MALQRLTAFGVGLANNEQAVTRKLSLLYRRDIADLGLAPVAQQPASGSTSTSTSTSTTAGAAPAAAAPADGSGSGPGPCTPPDDTSTRLLAQLGIHPPCFAHPEAPTVADWRPFQEKYAPDARMCKNLFMKDKKKSILLLVVALAETAVDLKMLEEEFGVRNLRLARPEVLMEALGLKKGAVTPLALVEDPEHKIRLVLDKAMLDIGNNHNLLFHPITGNTFSLGLRTAQLEAYLQHTGHAPVVVSFPPPA